MLMLEYLCYKIWSTPSDDTRWC